MNSMVHSAQMYPLHHVPLTRPFIWLGRGWDDIRHTPAASLAYGWLVASLGALALAYFRQPVYVAATIAAYLLVGPVITAGICELSRRRDHGETSSFQLSLSGLANARHTLIGFASLIALLAVVLFSVAALALYMITGAVAPDPGAMLWGDLTSQLSGAQLVAYLFAFVALAGIVFAISVVTVPMIVDRHVDVGTAIGTSLRAIARNGSALVLWAGLVVGLVLFGFATWLLGMIVVVPLLGHATWHAYRDIVEEA